MVQPQRQPAHKIRRLGGFQRLPDFLIGGVGLSPADVVADGARKQTRPLGNQPDAASQGGQGIVFHAVSEHFHFALSDVVEPQQQRCQR